jgi:hypothetical protein
MAVFGGRGNVKKAGARAAAMVQDQGRLLIRLLAPVTQTLYACIVLRNVNMRECCPGQNPSCALIARCGQGGHRDRDVADVVQSSRLCHDRI